MGKVLPQGQPDFGGVDMAAIIRHFRGSGERACRFGISEKTAYCAPLPHLRPSFAENKFNRPEKNSGSEHFLAVIRGQTTFPVLRVIGGFVTAKHKSAVLSLVFNAPRPVSSTLSAAELLPKKVL
jgi:hypothetical protein